MIRGLKGILALVALAALGLALRWMTAGSIGAANSHDLDSMAVLAVGTVAWMAYGWLTLAVLATVLEQIPGAIGAAASSVTGRITSQTSRTLLRSALGVAAITPLTVTAAHATPTNTPWRTTEPASTVRLSADSPSTGTPTSTNRLTASTPSSTNRPTNEPPSTVRLTGPAPASTAGIGRPHDAVPTTPRRTGLPAQAGARGDVPGSARVRVGVPDRPTSGAATRYTDVRSGQPVRVPARVVVKPGDTLWSIAATELGPNATAEDVAARWPAWYDANRQQIGPDPDLIRPGQVLRIPAAATGNPVPPTHQEK
jgi:nucleoid-associated protein YgaU